ncbi:hypothetical protein BG011_000142, partial [Mortierella polycephala]
MTRKTYFRRNPAPQPHHTCRLDNQPGGNTAYRFKEAFNLYDRKGTGNIPTSSLGDLLRAIGQNPTQLEIKELVAEADPSGSNQVSFDTFSKAALRPDGFKPAGTANELIDGFKVFDTSDTGLISAQELEK